MVGSRSDPETASWDVFVLASSRLALSMSLVAKVRTAARRRPVEVWARTARKTRALGLLTFSIGSRR